MGRCASCGHENPDAAKFCMECGGPVAASPAAADLRKLVTVLFCDLVGYTGRSELLDPEDVRAFLLPYYDLLEEEAERHGGTIDKFLGDGAMVLFGLPVAHEDDPERAVRMALRVVERLPELGLELHARAGVNTGEVLLAPGGLQRGDAVTGDVANTASRLQGAAPVDGVVVGERTWRATADRFDYHELAPAELKGKSEAVRIFHALGRKARVGSDLMETAGAPLAGRERELARLQELVRSVVETRSPRLVTVAGEPGLGKSRLVAELRSLVGLEHGPRTGANEPWFR